MTSNRAVKFFVPYEARVIQDFSQLWALPFGRSPAGSLLFPLCLYALSPAIFRVYFRVSSFHFYRFWSDPNTYSTGNEIWNHGVRKLTSETHSQTCTVDYTGPSTVAAIINRTPASNIAGFIPKFQTNINLSTNIFFLLVLTPIPVISMDGGQVEYLDSYASLLSDFTDPKQIECKVSFRRIWTQNIKSQGNCC